MILCLSSSFLLRVRMQWRPDLRGFLVGHRTLHFFYPDSLVEAPEISPATIDSFLAKHGNETMQLLGFLSPTGLPLLPGYTELIHDGQSDPEKWSASLHGLGEAGEEKRKLEIRVGS